MLFAGDLAFSGGHPIVLEGSIAGFRTALRRMRDLDAGSPAARATARPAAATTYRVLDDLDGYLAYEQEVARRVVRRRTDPAGGGAEAPRQPYEHWAETERFVCNLHRAYAELDPGYEPPVPLRIPSLWPEMVAFHGGPIACHA